MAGFDPAQASPLSAITKMKTPVLLVHSRADDFIPFAHSQRLHAAAPDHSELIAVDGQSHLGMWLDSIDLIETSSVDWFNHYLAGVPSTQAVTP